MEYQEKEKKFILSKDCLKWLNDNNFPFENVIQSYPCISDTMECRVRKSGSNEKWNYSITFKSISTSGTRDEFNFKLLDSESKNIETANVLIEKTKIKIAKKRYFIKKGLTIDEFENGLLMLEHEIIPAIIESSLDEYRKELVPFILKEVTTDPEYYNSEMAKKN